MGRGPGSSERSGRDEPMWFAIHQYLEARLGISLYSYLYLKLAKTLYLFIISYILSSTKSENKRVEKVLPGSGSIGVGRSGTMYTHVSKCKNDKIKRVEKKKRM
jgi:hypothetical protein